ncbi:MULTISPECIES: hypothetical protein [unclassified Roseivirga]|uniref:hypothetical protein n=1 Tax=unclassified Roseivirga TaxID=2626142 RepID=UPI00257B0672|nr:MULTISPECIES: hypothetical protein [unclassified Roseivirga]|tara:strand:- start:1111 stop:1686 length:576 start_codon:yes stop_codon:yes gene_type:complete
MLCKNLLRLNLAIVGLALPTLLYAQKLERESRIKPEEVPPQALTYLTTGGVEKAQWYFEEGLSSTSLEAKFKHDKRWFSVEFSEDGSLQDIEVTIRMEELNKATRNRILEEFERQFGRYKIRKVQVQYQSTSLATLIQKKMPLLSVPHAFEIVVKGKKGKLPKLWEFTFSAQGELLSLNQIITRNSEHLEY